MDLLSLLLFAGRRLKSRLMLNTLYALCVALTIGIAVSVPVFSDAVSRTMMQQELAERTRTTLRPPFSVRFYNLPSSRGRMTIDEAAYTRDWLVDSLTRNVGLSATQVYAQYESPSFQLRARSGSSQYVDESLGSVRVAVVPDIEKHVTVVEGAELGTPPAPGILSVWMMHDYAQKIGMQVGEVFELSYLQFPTMEPVVIKIEGFLDADDPTQIYWYRDPNQLLEGAFLTDADQYRALVEPTALQGTGFNFWYIVLNDAQMNLDHAERYVEGIQSTEREAVRRLPNAKMDYSPAQELLRGQARKQSLSAVLLGFSVPLMGVLVLFMVSVSAMYAHYQAQETAMLASRGFGRSHILLLTAIETLILLLLGGGPGIGLGLLLTRSMGTASSFLAFATREPMNVYLATANWGLIASGLALGLVSRLVPAASSMRYSVVTYEHHVARRRAVQTVGRALGLALLALVTAYSYQQLEQQGTIMLGAWQLGEDAPFDPLTLLAPSLFLFAAPLLAAELFAMFMRALALIGRMTPSISAYLGSLSLGREGGQYRMPTYLLVLSLSLGIFYASVAKSADVWLVDRRHYEVGADLTFAPHVAGWAEGMAGSENLALLPTGMYEEVDGVDRAARVGLSRARAPRGSGLKDMRLMAIDAQDFPSVTFLRDDYATQPLPDQLATLASVHEGVLLPEDVARQMDVAPGETLSLGILVDEEWFYFDFALVGTFSYFPTMYKDEASIAVVNLSYLEFYTGGYFPHNVWLKLDDDADSQLVLDNMVSLGVLPVQARDVRGLLAEDLARLERVGIFGMLSICFLAAAVTAGAGLLVYSFASITGRSYRFAILQALGMQKREVMGTVSFEYLVTLVFGLAAGLGLGLIAAEIYVPFFAITEKPVLPVPPFLPYVDWRNAGWMAVIMGITLVFVQATIMVRMMQTRVFEALRMGMKE